MPTPNCIKGAGGTAVGGAGSEGCCSMVGETSISALSSSRTTPWPLRVRTNVEKAVLMFLFLFLSRRRRNFFRFAQSSACVAPPIGSRLCAFAVLLTSVALRATRGCMARSSRIARGCSASCTSPWSSNRNTRSFHAKRSRTTTVVTLPHFRFHTKAHAAKREAQPHAALSCRVQRLVVHDVTASVRALSAFNLWCPN